MSFYGKEGFPRGSAGPGVTQIKILLKFIKCLLSVAPAEHYHRHLILAVAL